MSQDRADRHPPSGTGGSGFQGGGTAGNRFFPPWQFDDDTIPLSVQ